MKSRHSGWRALLLTLGALPFVAGGCTVFHSDIGRPIDPPDIRPADSALHYREVLAARGPPARISTSNAKVLFLYEHTTIRERQLGFNFDAPWLNLIKFSFGSGDADRQAILFVFDETGHLEFHRFREWTDELGGGTAAQFVTSVLSVVDTGDLEEGPFQHRWGARALEPDLTVGLNGQNSLETGGNGLELLGTPDGAGQHTLEHRSIRAQD